MQLVWKLRDHNKNKEVKFLLQACAIISPTFEKGVFFFKYNDLQLIFDALKVNPAFPLPKSNVTYKSESGEDILRVKLANNESSAGDCSMCNKKVNKEKWRTHMGKHQLNNEVPVYSCGFCGKMGCSHLTNFQFQNQIVNFSRSSL